MTKLDFQTAKEISELLEEGKALDEIRKSVKWHGGTINAWIALEGRVALIPERQNTLKTAQKKESI